MTASLRKTGRGVMVDESAGYGGVSAEIAASLQEAAFDYLDGPIGWVHAAHSPVPQSPALIKAMMPSGQPIVDEVTPADGVVLTAVPDLLRCA